MPKCLTAAPFPEFDLLLECARWPQRPDDQRLIAEHACAPLDWGLFLRLAERHRIVPLVAHNLQAAVAQASQQPGAESGYAFALAELRRSSQASAHQALRTLAELRRVTQAFAALGIRVCVLKGLPLTLSVYGDLALRPAGDIDLLIDESAIAAIDHVLRGFGYESSMYLERLPPRQLAFYCRHWKDVTYSDHARGFEIDLHWRCFRNPEMPGNALYTGAARGAVSFGGLRVETLPRTEGLLYLCVHGVLDGWIYLKALVDVGAQVRTMSEAELDALAGAAIRNGVLPELSATLALVRRWLAMDHWSARLLGESDRTVAHILRYAERTLVRGGFLAPREAVPIAATLAFEFGLRRGLRYWREPLLRVLFRSRMWETIPLPDALFWLYPLLSPLEWIVYRMRQPSMTRAGAPVENLVQVPPKEMERGRSKMGRP